MKQKITFNINPLSPQNTRNSQPNQFSPMNFKKMMHRGLFILVILAMMGGVFKVVTTQATHTEASFAPHIEYTAGGGFADFQSAMASVDLNGDNNLDLVKPNNWDDSVSVLMGNGDGTFDTKVDYPIAGDPYSVATADLNGDTFMDILSVGSQFSSIGSISVLLGNGDGTFQTHEDYSLGLSSTMLKVVDLNDDNILDVIGINNGAGSISVLLGNGDGTFQTHEDYAVGSSPYGGLTTSDFNNDDFVDIVVANQRNSISVLMGNGDGTFSNAVNYTTGTEPDAVESGDLNGDTFPDVVTANSISNNISVFINNGDGTFANKVDYATGGISLGLSLLDLNGDDNLDAVTVDCNGSVSVFMGNGNGTFDAKVSYTTGGCPYMIRPGQADFNKDGILDFAVSSYEDSIVSVLIGNGDGTFQDAQNFDATGGPYGQMITDDFNNDSLPDMVIADSGSSLISILLNNLDLPAVEFPAATASGSESTTSPAIDVSLSAANDVDVNVDYAVTGGTATGGGVDYTLASGTLNIPEGATLAEIPLAIINDSSPESSETIQITLSNSTNSILGNNDTLTYTITGNDTTGTVTSGSSSNGGSGSEVNSGGLQFPATFVPPATPVMNQDGTSNTNRNPINPRSPNSAPLIAPADLFTRNLGYGDKGEDVKRLQKFLNMNEYILGTNGPGAPSQETTFFGPKTRKAVTTFQEQFADRILTPLGLAQGTGYFGDLTRAFVNSLLK
jgi:hypothetical protein